MNEQNTQPEREAREAKKAPRGTVLAITLSMLLVAMMIATTSRVGKRAMARFQVEDARAPEVSLVDVNTGRRVSTTAHEGKVILLDFWATWCPPCKKQMPILEKLSRDESLADRVKILSINTDEIEPARRKKVKQFVNQHELTITTLLDDGRASHAYHVFSIPTMVVIGADGQVKRLVHGVHTEAQLREIIADASQP